MTDTRDLVMTFDLPHAPEKVWRALTEPELLARWLMKTDMQAAPGHGFQFKMEHARNWDAVVNCEIIEVRQHRFLSYTWRAQGVDTVVSWTLEPTSTGTLLKLEQTGFKPDQQQAYGGARAGWTHMAGEKLREVLAELA